jgi:hypothetical protein
VVTIVNEIEDRLPKDIQLVLAWKYSEKRYASAAELCAWP